MAFFQQNPAFNQPSEIENQHSHSPKIPQLFKLDSANAQSQGSVNGGLERQNLLAKAVEEVLNGAAESTSQSSQRFIVFQPKPPMPAYLLPEATGQRMSTLDVDLPAGLEQYLPSQRFRAHVVITRLNQEIAALQEKLNQYCSLSPTEPALQAKIKTIQQRLLILQNHHRKVSFQIQQQQTMTSGLSTWISNLRQFANPGLVRLGAIQPFLFRLFLGPGYVQLKATCAEIEKVEDLLTRQINSPVIVSRELAALVNHYEKMTRQAETQSQPLSQKSFRTFPGSFIQGLWQEVKRLVK